MRKIMLMLLLGLISAGVSAQSAGVKWEEGTFSQALEKASKKSKPVFLDCYTSWCGPCKQMANQVFTLPEAGEFFNSNFVNIKIDMEKGEGVALKEKYNVKAFPTFIILDGKGNETGRIVGGGGLEEFIGKVKTAMQAENTPDALKAKYLRSKNGADALAYMSRMEEAYMPEKIVEFVEENYDSFGRALYSEPFWKYVAVALSSEKVYEKVLADKYGFDEALSAGAVNKAISEALYNKLVAYLTGKMQLSPEQVKQIVRDLAFAKEGRNLMLCRVVSNLAVAHAGNDTAAIQKALNLNFLNQRLTGHERFMLNAFVLQKSVFLSSEQRQEYKTKIK